LLNLKILEQFRNPMKKGVGVGKEERRKGDFSKTDYTRE
jgi:hypothetical protein